MFENELTLALVKVCRGEIDTSNILGVFFSASSESGGVGGTKIVFFWCLPAKNVDLAGFKP